MGGRPTGPAPGSRVERRPADTTIDHPQDPDELVLPCFEHDRSAEQDLLTILQGHLPGGPLAQGVERHRARPCDEGDQAAG